MIVACGTCRSAYGMWSWWRYCRWEYEMLLVDPDSLSAVAVVDKVCKTRVLWTRDSSCWWEWQRLMLGSGVLVSQSLLLLMRYSRYLSCELVIRHINEMLRYARSRTCWCLWTRYVETIVVNFNHLWHWRSSQFATSSITRLLENFWCTFVLWQYE